MNRENEQEMEELRIGRLLAAGLEDMAKGIPCLTEDQLDALVAGTLQGEERDSAINHVAGCAVCRHAFIVTSRLAAADEKEHEDEVAKGKVVPFPAKHVRPAWNYTVPLALAATLLLAIGLYRFFPGKGEAPSPMPEGASQSAQAPVAPPAPLVAQTEELQRKPKMTRQDSLLALAGRLGTTAKGKELDIPFVSANQAGFTGSGGAESDRFHAGFALLSLTVACDAGDTATYRRAATSLHERVQKLDLPKGEAAKILALAEDSIKGSLNTKGCIELAMKADTALNARYGDDPYRELGMLSAALLLSAQTKNSELLTAEPFRQALHRLARLEKPGGVGKKVAELAALVAAPLDNAAWSKIEQLADDIQKRF